MLDEHKLLRRPSKPVEPILENRYLIIFPEEMGIPVCPVRSVSRPTMSINNGSPPYFVTYTTWNDMEIIFNGRMEQLYEQLYNKVYRNFMSYDHTTRKMEIKLKIISPTGVVVSEWVVMGLISSFSYHRDDLMVNFNVDYAILNF